MLSILIPIYNYPVYELVNKLSTLASKSNIEFEILCIDDASTEHKEENLQINSIPGVTVENLSSNIGRSALRNLLAQKAKYPNLLFIDTDMLIPSENFILNYIDAIDKADVVYGGIVYEKTPKSSKHMLRWKYGNKREAISSTLREKEPYFSVKTCNLLIKKSIFETVRFNENIREYGHEDTLFCIELERHRYKVLHIDNPTIHLGVERSDIYLNKVEMACVNLARIEIDFLKAEEKEHVRLIYFFLKLQKMGLIPILEFFYKIIENRVLRNLLSEQPNLTYLDYFKLIAYAKAVKNR